MRTRPLGRTGIQAGPYCVGAVDFGIGDPDRDDCARIAPPGADPGPLDTSCAPPTPEDPASRRRHAAERAAGRR